VAIAMVNIERHDGRSQNVSSIVKKHGDAVGGRKGCLVVDRLKQDERPGYILVAIQRLQQLFAGAPPPLIFPLDATFVQVRSIQPHDFEQFTTRRRRVHESRITILDQERHQGGVIQMCVRQHNGVDAVDLKRPGCNVSPIRIAPTLNQTTVEKNSGATCVNQITRARHFTRGTSGVIDATVLSDLRRRFAIAMFL
jgi:hypothetical protein